MLSEMTHPSDRLIVALDTASAAQAQELVTQLGDAVGIYKVGKQLFTAEGPQIVRDLVAAGRKVFLDLKFHDIPNTVAAAVRAACELRVSMLTVHAAGGKEMMRQAAEAASAAAHPPLVLAVTVLTSLSDDDLHQVGVSGRAIDQVVRLAKLAQKCECNGIVASAVEATELRKQLGKEIVIVTPGVRPAGTAKGDQTRVATPREAVAAGASYIVVGRPITEAADPAAAARAILSEISVA